MTEQYKWNNRRNILILFLALMMTISLLSGCSFDSIDNNGEKEAISMEEVTLDPEGSYNAVEEVALYLHQYGELPPNYITKSEASQLGWVPSEGNLWEVTEEKSIGGDRFGNREGLLPDRSGREYYECDVNYDGGYRGPERIVYSNDGLIYYTADHYESFELLYGEE